MQAEQQKIIDAITTVFSLGSFAVDGQTFEIVSRTKYSVTARGAKGAEYTVHVWPKKSVSESAALTVYSLSRKARQMFYFTCAEGQVVRLHA